MVKEAKGCQEGMELYVFQTLTAEKVCGHLCVPVTVMDGVITWLIEEACAQECCTGAIVQSTVQKHFNMVA